ncbi:SIS domain-containing protein [Candidatus Pelagibacter ubique]|uniref:D-sedoheptulose-7-phosphate isomerase n=1 Tax=Pelagibacter ubique TaxID=198252 RepID=UPI0003C7ED28
MINLKKHIANSINLRKKIFKFSKDINFIIEKIYKCLKDNNKVFICGNGGSAADAQHISAEFLVRLNPKINRKSFPIICLGNDMTYLTACGNDYGFNEVFSRHLSGLNKKDENNILICLSTSGNSKNIINVLKKAKSEKIFSISFLGKGGGGAKKISDKSITILTKNTALIQEEHMFLAHYILNAVEKKLLSRN